MLLPCAKLMKLDPCLLRHCQWGSFIGNCSFTEKTVITEFFLYFIGNMFYRIFIFCKYRFFLYYSLFSVLQFFSCKSFIGFIFQKSHFFTVYFLYYRKKSFYRIEACQTKNTGPCHALQVWHYYTSNQNMLWCIPAFRKYDLILDFEILHHFRIRFTRSADNKI